jgi:hypothetical protein
VNCYLLCPNRCNRIVPIVDGLRVVAILSANGHVELGHADR